jgi:hypothetical protein
MQIQSSRASCGVMQCLLSVTIECACSAFNDLLSATGMSTKTAMAALCHSMNDTHGRPGCTGNWCIKRPVNIQSKSNRHARHAGLCNARVWLQYGEHSGTVLLWTLRQARPPKWLWPHQVIPSIRAMGTLPAQAIGVSII